MNHCDKAICEVLICTMPAPLCENDNVWLTKWFYATNPWHCPISMLSHIVTYSNWHSPLCNGLFPLDHEVLRHLWIFSRLKSNESVTIPFTYIQMICTSKCFFVYLMYIFVRAYLQSIIGCAYALYSTKCFLYMGLSGLEWCFFGAMTILTQYWIRLLCLC